MRKRLSVADAVRLTGWSESWLRTHCCGWCDQSALEAVRGNCGAIQPPRCTTESRIASLKKLRERPDA